MKIEEVRRILRDLVDEDYRKFQAALIPGVENFLGVRRVELKKLAKQIAKEDGLEFIRCAGRDSFEEVMLKGLVIGSLKTDTEELLRLVSDYVPEITDWSLCDTFCSVLKAVKKDRERFWGFLKPYLHSGKEFEARFGAVMLLTYYIGEGWTEKTLEALYEVRQEGYYARMAVAWAYSVCYIKEPEKTGGFLAVHPLPEFVYRKTVSKICDSLAVPALKKEQLKKYGFG